MAYTSYILYSKTSKTPGTCSPGIKVSHGAIYGHILIKIPSYEAIQK